MTQPTYLIPPSRVLDAVAAATGVPVSVMVTRRRTRSVVDARHLAMLLMRDLTALSLSEIGALLGGRDHSTVAWGLDAMRQRVRADAAFGAHVELVRASCFGLPDAPASGT